MNDTPLRSRLPRFALFAVLLSSSGLTYRASAEACSPGEHIWPGDPAPATTGFPTDGIPFVLATPSATVALFGVSGTQIPTVQTRLPLVNGTYGAVEIHPVSPLAPLTAYEIRSATGSTSSPTAISFTTGDGPSVAPPPATPSIVLDAAMRADHVVNSCSGSGGLCAFASEAVPLEITFQFSGGGSQRVLVPATGLPSSESIGLRLGEFCVDVRARDALGRRSDPVHRCTANDLAVRSVLWPDELAAATCVNGRVQGTEAHGCSVGRVGRRGSTRSLLAMALGVAFVAATRLSRHCRAKRAAADFSGVQFAARHLPSGGALRGPDRRRRRILVQLGDHQSSDAGGRLRGWARPCSFRRDLGQMNLIGQVVAVALLAAACSTPQATADVVDDLPRDASNPEVCAPFGTAIFYCDPQPFAAVGCNIQPDWQCDSSGCGTAQAARPRLDASYPIGCSAIVSNSATPVNLQCWVSSCSCVDYGDSGPRPGPGWFCPL